MNALSDLTPRKDPKGGSPKTPTPGGIPRKVYDEWAQENPMPVLPEPSTLTHHGFFHFDLKDWLQFGVLVVMAILFVFQRQSDINTLTNNVTNMTKTVDSLVVVVDSLKKITDGNSSDVRMQAERNLEQDRRISANEAQLAGLVPDVREIRTKLNFVADLLDQRAKDHK